MVRDLLRSSRTHSQACEERRHEGFRGARALAVSYTHPALADTKKEDTWQLPESQRSNSTSTTSFEDAIKTGLDRANATLRNVEARGSGAAGSPRRRLHLRVPGEHARDVHPRRRCFVQFGIRERGFRTRNPLGRRLRRLRDQVADASTGRNPRARDFERTRIPKAAAFAAAARPGCRRLDWSKSASAESARVAALVALTACPSGPCRAAAPNATSLIRQTLAQLRPRIATRLS